MTNPQLILETIVTILGILGTVFGVYNYLRNPQISADKTNALLSQSLLQVQKDLANLRDNHVHTLDMKMDEAMSRINELAIQVAKLSTVIEERIPKRVL